MKAVVISNCQVQPLQSYIALYCRDIEIDVLGIHFIHPGNRDSKIQEFMRDSYKYDLVISIPLSDEFGPLSTGRIRDTFRGITVLMISNIVFYGLHPDLTYLGGFSKRLPGALGDYHSKIATVAFSKGLSLRATRDLFQGNTYERLGYFDIYGQSFDELLRRDEAASVDIKVTDQIDDAARQGVPFYSNNHPSALITAPYSERIANWLSDHGLFKKSGWPPSPAGVVDHLANNAIFPIYSEIAEHFSCPGGSYAFRSVIQTAIPPTPMDLEEFLAAEFRALAEIDPVEFKDNETVRNLMNQYGDLLLP